ncbi:MAG TPA: GNAT family N-acetyltransferase [Pyrinomonadaceae bacterium]|nr:GNAT family N-acetyltransferase [Pyrinomonadaceae bacterium]
MHTQSARTVQQPSATSAPWATFAAREAEPLAERHKAEVLAFLRERPLHTVYLAGYILDNGVVSPLNRGTFYGYRGLDGRLEGVALVGHATLFEARTDAALAAFAALAQKCTRTHMLLGEMDKVEHFWNHYAEGGQTPRLVCRELLFEQKFPVEVKEPVRGLRQATLADLDLVMPVHARMAEEESGINPLEKDPNGFRLRCARRIEQGRVWVLVQDGRLVFKADVVSDTSEVIYLEGIYVVEGERGRGTGRRCLSQLTRTLLARTKVVSLLVNEQNRAASDFYLKAGFKLRAHYDTIFLQQASA